MACSTSPPATLGREPGNNAPRRSTSFTALSTDCQSARSEQFVEGAVGAEDRIDAVVVVRVIPMVGGRPEDGVEVDRGDPEVGQPVEVLGNAEEVAALVAVERRGRVPRLEIDRLANSVGLREAIGEDLIEDGIPDPLGFAFQRHAALAMAC